MLFNILKIHNHETTKGIEKTNKRNQKKKTEENLVTCNLLLNSQLFLTSHSVT